jgi:hypothetical protein
MKLDYVPLLKVQRELHDIPRGTERFRQYLRTIWSPAGAEGELISLLLMNPLGRDHVAALLDALLALDADGIAARTAADVSAQLPDVTGDCKVALVVADDLRGGASSKGASVFPDEWHVEVLQSVSAKPFATPGRRTVR